VRVLTAERRADSREHLDALLSVLRAMHARGRRRPWKGRRSCRSSPIWPPYDGAQGAAPGTCRHKLTQAPALAQSRAVSHLMLELSVAAFGRWVLESGHSSRDVRWWTWRAPTRDGVGAAFTTSGLVEVIEAIGRARGEVRHRNLPAEPRRCFGHPHLTGIEGAPRRQC
jgi:hypothetical protein